MVAKPSSPTRLASVSSTDTTENSFNWLQEKARRDKAEKQAPITQWQRTVASPFMEAKDKRPLQLSELAHRRRVPASSRRQSANAAWGDAWPHPSPQASLLIREAWYLLRSFRDRWDNLQHAWRSLLAMLGRYLYHRTDKLGNLVLQSVRYSCLSDNNMAALHPQSRVGPLYQTRGRGRCDSRRSPLAASSLDGVG